MAKINLIRRLCLLAVSLALAGLYLFPHNPIAASGNDAKWARVNIPTQGSGGGWVLADGSAIQHLTMAADGTLYACAQNLNYTLYRSTDGGNRWSHIGNVQDSIVAIAISADSEAIYYATNSHVYRSTDGGNTFKALPASPGGAGSNNVEITSLTVARQGSNIIAVGTRDTDGAQFGGVYTLDEAEAIPTWDDTGLDGYDVYALAASPNFAADRQLVAVATDETDTFVTTRFAEAAWGANAGDVRLDRDNSGAPTAVSIASSAAIAFPDDYDATSADFVLFIAIDTGSGNGDVYRVNGTEAPASSQATDLNTGSAYGLDNTDITGLAVAGDAASASLLAGAAESAQTYASTDGGRSWERSRKKPSGGSATYVLLAPDFASSGEADATTGGSESAFSISRDSGATWNAISLIDTDISTIIDLAPSPAYSQDRTLFLLTYDSWYNLWRSLDDGSSWEMAFSSNLPNVDSISRVALTPDGGSGQALFLAGSGNGNPVIWKSTNGGQTFARYPAIDAASGSAITIDTWAVVDDTTLFIGGYDGSNGLVYRTTNSGFTYSSGAPAGSQPLSSIALSPDYAQDSTVLAGNTDGWVLWSPDNGVSFQPLPPDAGAPPLTGSIAVAFDPDFASNRTVYAASNTAGAGVFRFIIGKSSDWESMDGTMPSGSMLNQIIVSAEGALYTANAKADGGVERSLDPSYSLGPLFETVSGGLGDGATLSGLWQNGDRLWSADTTNVRLMALTDSLTSPVALDSPADGAPGIGTVINHALSNISLDWGTLEGATSYQWQLDYDTDFSSVPDGFEGSTKASSVRLPALEPATTYYWRVKAATPVSSPWSAKRSFTTSLDNETVSLQPESPEPGASGVPIRPLFQWSAIAGADRYELLVSADIDFANPSVARTGGYALPTNA
ncbi:MAG: hypothetical protein V1691_01745 [Chloroflexota bacterium]